MFLPLVLTFEMDETWSSRRRAHPQGAGDGNCGAGVVDGACGAVGRVAWVGIGTLSVPMPTHIRCVATPVSRKAHLSGHRRCLERGIADTQRPERPFRGISHVPNAPS